MADVDMEKLRVAATEIIAKVVEEDKLECVHGSPSTDAESGEIADCGNSDREFTHGSFRKTVEESMGLEAGTLDASQYRKAVRKIAEDYIVSYCHLSAWRL